MPEDTTTIQITKEDDKRLQELKLHPSQPVREIVHLLLEEKEEKDTKELIASEIKQHWELLIDLAEIKGKKREELLKRGYI